MQSTVRRKKSRGQAVVEFAIMLPVFLLLTLGVVDMTRIFTAYIALTNAASNAALYAGQGGENHWCALGGSVACPGAATAGEQFDNPANIAYQIQVEATGLDMTAIGLAAPLCTLTVGGTTENCTSTLPGQYSKVKITVTYHMGFMTPLISTFLGSQLNMTATTSATVQ